MTEHWETIPAERTSRTPVVQQHAPTAECDGFHGRCPDAGRFGPEQVGTIAGTMAVYERDKAASELASLRAHATSLAEDLDDAGATIGDYREALTVMQRERDAARSARTAAETDGGRLRAEVESANELLKRAADALWESSKAALTVKSNLDKPYNDDPRWTPWTRWAERPAHEAHDAAMAIRKHLRAAGIDPGPSPAFPSRPRPAAVSAPIEISPGAWMTVTEDGAASGTEGAGG